MAHQRRVVRPFMLTPPDGYAGQQDHAPKTPQAHPLIVGSGSPAPATERLSGGRLEQT